jgi:membrane protein implicated in regulation of membrane protease activity
MVIVPPALPAAVVTGADAAFYAVFGLFLAAFFVLAVVSLRWAVRRDRAGRDEWLHRQAEGGRPPVPPTATNGHGTVRPGGRRRGAPR